MRKRLALGIVIAAALSSGRAAAAAPWIAVVVPAAAPAGTLSAETLAAIYKRKKLFWDDGGRIQPVNLPADHPLRQRFSSAVLKQSPEALEDYWNELYFQGVQPPHVLASEAAVSRFVGSTPRAIGYLAACSVGASLRVVMWIDAEQQLRPAETPVECGAP